MVACLYHVDADNLLGIFKGDYLPRIGETIEMRCKSGAITYKVENVVYSVDVSIDRQDIKLIVSIQKMVKKG